MDFGRKKTVKKMHYNDCNVLESCNPDFVDDLEDNCSAYKINKYCTSTGDYGPGWEFNEDGSPADTFEEYAVNGQTALVCPECGCGRGNQILIAIK